MLMKKISVHRMLSLGFIISVFLLAHSIYRTVTFLKNFNDFSSSKNVNIINFAIFFHTFAKADEASRARAQEIIKSQLKEINSQPLLDGAPLFYARIGDFDWKWPVSECNRNLTSSADPHEQRQCTQIAAMPKGDEMISLQNMHQYCARNQQVRVVYMHSKGTYHASSHNNQLRTILMKAITSKECLDFPIDGSCHTCSTSFSYTPWPHYTGNMFVAECSYISKLIPPNEFEPIKRRVVAQMKRNTKKINSNWYETELNNRTHYKFEKDKIKSIERKPSLGVGRWAAESWLGSHPDLKPCEVFSFEHQNPKIIYGKKIKLDKFKPPQLEKIQETISAKNISLLVEHPWYGIDGRLYSYEQLYSTIPQNGSWFYNLWGRS